MKYILDTNAVSAAMSNEPNIWKQLTERSAGDVLIPQPVLAEIAYGLARLPESARRTRLAHRFRVLADSQPRAAWTDDVSGVFGQIKAELAARGVLLEDFDTAIAAHALALDGVLVTGNTRHFERIPDLRLEDWVRASGTRNDPSEPSSTRARS